MRPGPLHLSVQEGLAGLAGLGRHYHCYRHRKARQCISGALYELLQISFYSSRGI